MEILEINKYKDFAALKPSWNNTLRTCEHSVFSTWEWLSTWWKHFGNDKKLLLLIAKENDRMIGIAPLMYLVQKMFGLRMGKIEFICTPHSDYNDFILTEKSEECIPLLINHLNNLPEKWDCIDLIDIPENAKCLPILSKISTNLRQVHKCPYAHLPKSYDAFLLGLKRKYRKELLRYVTLLEKDGFKV